MTFDWSRNFSLFVLSFMFLHSSEHSLFPKYSKFLSTHFHKQLRLSLFSFLNYLFSTLSSNIPDVNVLAYIWLKWCYHTHWSLVTNCIEHCCYTGGSWPLLGKVPSIDSLFIVYFMKKNLIPFNYVITFFCIK